MYLHRTTLELFVHVVKVVDAPVVLQHQMPYVQTAQKNTGYFRAQYLGHVIDIPVVTQPQVPMFPKMKSTTEIPQVPFMMVHRWLPLGTGRSISQLFHITMYQRSR